MKANFFKLDIDDLKRDIHRLMKATSDATDESVIAARERLSSILGRAGEGAERAGTFVRGHPFETAAIAVFTAAITGFILARKSS